MRALVTGGAGFIGSNLVDALLDRGDEVKRRLLAHLRAGLRYGYPPCCIFRYLIDRAAEYLVDTSIPSAIKRGSVQRTRPDGTKQGWVPCRCGAHGGAPWKLEGRLVVAHSVRSGRGVPHLV